MSNILKQPHEYQRRILLAVAGTTPQILTETLHALTQSQAGFVPTEVHVVTTLEGSQRIMLQLLDKQHGMFHAFCNDYGLTGKIEFKPDFVHVLHDAAGNSLSDIVSPQDNELAADQIIECLRSFTQDPDCAVHACLAGGRKTMGFYLGYGLSLYGRLQDRLSHVLVSPDFESHREFFYIPPVPRTLFVSTMVGNRVDERPVTTTDARIWLAEIPFVRLRDGLPKRLLEGRANYTEAVLALQASLPDNLLVLDVRRRVAICGGLEVKMPPREFAFYVWHVKRRFESGCVVAISWKDMLGKDNLNLQSYFECYLEVLGGDQLQPDYLDARRALENGFEKETWQQVIHHVNERIKKVLGVFLAEPYLLKGEKVTRGSQLKAFTLNFPAERIRINT